LNDYVEFNDKQQKFVWCINKKLFTNCNVGDEIEINLTKAKYMDSNNYHQEIVKIKPKSYVEGQYGDCSPQYQDERSRQLQTQEQITLLVSAYDKKVAHKLFRNSLE